MLEWLGNEELAYFRLEGARASARELDELAADAGATDVPHAGISWWPPGSLASRAREGEQLELRVDPPQGIAVQTPTTAPTTSRCERSVGGRLLVAVGDRQHAGGLAPRLAHGIGETADTLRQSRNG